MPKLQPSGGNNSRCCLNLPIETTRLLGWLPKDYVRIETNIYNQSITIFKADISDTNEGGD